MIKGFLKMAAIALLTGHVNISFGSGRAGQKVNVSLGEQRTTTGTKLTKF